MRILTDSGKTDGLTHSSFDEIAQHYEIKIVNFERMNYLNHGISNEENVGVLNAVLSEQPAVVAFSLYVWNVAHAHELAEAIKEMEPGILTVAGGPGASDHSESRPPAIRATGAAASLSNRETV